MTGTKPRRFLLLSQKGKDCCEVIIEEMNIIVERCINIEVAELGSIVALNFNTKEGADYGFHLFIFRV